MSILIKGMEMPTRCGRCDMRIPAYDDGIFDHYECCITAAIIDNLGEKMEDCPLIPVPPHGRLIDGDVAEVISFTDEDARGGNFADGVMYAVDFISEMPTIIEAEPEVHVCDNCKWFGGLMCDHVDENYKCLGWEAEEVDNG